MGSHAHAC
jgi:hypothetical protein